MKENEKMRAERIFRLVEEKQEKFIELNDKIWAVPELGFEEYKSSELHIEALRSEGFEVETNVDNMETAFIASYGNGKPVIALLAEFDALPGLSQEANETHHKPVVPGGAGHGCMHNTLGAACVSAGVAVKDYLKEHPQQGTVRVYGCPGEEAGWSKMFLARDGYFDDVDAAFSWHACHCNGVMGYSSTANISVFFAFHGKAAHAAGAPYLGRSAVDACELMNVGVNYLREHIIPEARVHYAYANAGEKAPNVVHPEAKLHYYVRAPKMKTAIEILERIKDVARGAALMTGTTLDINVTAGMSDICPNDTISELMTNALIQAGPPDFDENDQALAQQFRDQYTPAEIDSAMVRINLHYPNGGGEKLRDTTLVRDIAPYVRSNKQMAGSSEVGDVSYVTPTALAWITCLPNGTPGHSWQVTAMAASSLVHKSLVCAAKTMALSTVTLFDEPETVKKAREELLRTTGGIHVCPVDKSVKPSKF